MSGRERGGGGDAAAGPGRLPVSARVTALPAAATPLTEAPLTEALAAMHRACFPEDPWDAAALGRILGLTGAFGFLAWRGDDPAGFVVARDLGDELEILSIGVLPALRRRGHARRLLDAVVAEAARRRSGSIVLEVAAANEPARRLYAGFGFSQVGRRPRYYRLAGGAADALILRRGAAGSSPAE